MCGEYLLVNNTSEASKVEGRKLIATSKGGILNV